MITLHYQILEPRPDILHQQDLTFVRRIALYLLRVDVTYREKSLTALADGPSIVVCNHQSFLDGIIMALACPAPLSFAVSNRQSEEIWFTRVGLSLLQKCGLGWVIPMNSSHPFAIRTLLRELSNGRSVAVFPEGRIVGKKEADVAPKRGVRWLVERSGVLVVQAEIAGAEDWWLLSPDGRRLFPRISLTL